MRKIPVLRLNSLDWYFSQIPLPNMIYLFKGHDLASIIDSLGQVYFAKNIDNLLVQLVNKIVHLYFILYYITILCSIFDLNKLMTYLFWSPTKTINFFRCLY